MGFVKKPLCVSKQHTQELVEQHIAQGIVLGASYSANGDAADNQDAYAIIPICETDSILLVSDGVGGHPGGDMASAAVLEAIVKYCVEERQDGQMLRDCVLTAIDSASEKIRENKPGAAATVCIALIEGNTVRPFYVGDSAILIAGKKGRLVFKNTEHSPIGYVEKSELLNDVQLSKLERTNEVFHLVGDQAMHIEIGPSIQLKQQDTMLLCSDGFTDNLYVEEIIDCIRVGTMLQAAERLISLNNLRIEQGGHRDDHTFILYRNRK